MILSDRERKCLIQEIEALAEKYANRPTFGKWPEKDYSAACNLKDAENFRALAQAIREDRVKFEAVA